MPTELVGRPELRRRAFGGESPPEYRFALADPRPRIPIRRDGTIQFARWGNFDGRSRRLPRTALARLSGVQAGEWARFGAVPVEIAASFWAHNGAWVFVREGIRGVLAPDEQGWAVCFVVCEPSTNYYKNMTGGAWMPVLIDQRY
ncbi:hypothetical protein [Tautonia plasticadhaerens]|uniref:hypothetical protein n=1 Tax=Tautonia plasticadhaerens TaxID=2527974 RepID=UPI0011A2FAB2|nr:hypothetical protein [Tautonia plasticadhaerens]